MYGLGRFHTFRHEKFGEFLACKLTSCLCSQTTSIPKYLTKLIVPTFRIFFCLATAGMIGVKKTLKLCMVDDKSVSKCAQKTGVVTFAVFRF